MSRLQIRVAVILSGMAALLASVRSLQAAPDFPVPSAYSVSWELKFVHGTPRRIAVDVTDSNVPRAYWYMTYTVTNETDKEQRFYPQIDLLTADGNIHKSDEKVPARVFEDIRLATHEKFLEPYTSISGPIRLGPAEARDGVAIWPETQPRMEHFSIFVTGLSGEAVIMKTVDGKLVKADKADEIYKSDKDSEDELLKKGLTIMRKTLQLNYYIRGDEVYPGEDEVNKADDLETVARLTAQIKQEEDELNSIDKRLAAIPQTEQTDTNREFTFGTQRKAELQEQVKQAHIALKDCKVDNEEWIMR